MATRKKKCAQKRSVLRTKGLSFLLITDGVLKINVRSTRKELDSPILRLISSLLPVSQNISAKTVKRSPPGLALHICRGAGKHSDKVTLSTLVCSCLMGETLNRPPGP